MKSRLRLLRMLAARLERLPVDSVPARQAAGLRRSVNRALDSAEGGSLPAQEQVDFLIQASIDAIRRSVQPTTRKG